jgi:hypothetical protein
VRRPVHVCCSAGAIALATLAACGGGGGGWGGGDGDGEPDASAPTAELVLGSASADHRQFVAIDDGDDVPLIPGSQGGFHVWTGLRVRGATGTLHLERQARRVSDDELVLLATTVELHVPDEPKGDWWERPDGTSDNALPSFMCPTPIGIRIRDEPLHLAAQILTEDDELLAEDELVFVPRCPDGDQADFCFDICSG